MARLHNSSKRRLEYAVAIVARVQSLNDDMLETVRRTRATIASSKDLLRSLESESGLATSTSRSGNRVA